MAPISACKNRQNQCLQGDWFPLLTRYEHAYETLRSSATSTVTMRVPSVCNSAFILLNRNLAFQATGDLLVTATVQFISGLVRDILSCE